MRSLILSALLAVTICFGFTQLSFAACVEGPPDTFTCNTNPPNPDLNGIQEEFNNNNLTVNVLPGAGIDTEGTPFAACIRTGNGTSIFDVNGADFNCEDDGINSKGNNTFNITDSTFKVGESIGEAIITSPGVNIINVLRSILDGGIFAINVTGGSTTTNVTDSTLTGRSEALCMGGINVIDLLRSQILCDENTGTECDAVDFSFEDDEITVVESLIRAGDTSDSDAIECGPGNDTTTLGTGANLIGRIACGPDFDTIIFAMDVPEEALPLVSSQIAAANPAGDTLVINGLTYTWTDCELLVSQLNGVRNVRPIPTLSEWGLIALAGVLGIVGFITIQRRKGTA